MTQKANEAAVNPNLFNFAETIGDNVESKLKFKPRLEFGNLCKGFLIKAEVIMNEAKLVDDNNIQSTWEYAGFMVPTLHLEFAQEPTTEDPNERFYDLYIRAFTNVTKKNEVIEPKKIIEHYQNEYSVLRHIANAFKGLANYDPKAAPIAFDFLNSNIKERLESITAYFESWVKIFNGIDGKGFAKQPLMIKLVASSSGTYLTLPSFVREGFIEKFVNGRKPSIELKPGETVTLVKADKKAKGDGAAAEGPAANGAAPINSEVEEMLKKYQS